jgi:putative inorganic carbon (hco3(-)) transporter
MPQDAKKFPLLFLFVILLLTPVITRILPEPEPIEYKYFLLKEASKTIIQLLIVMCALSFLSGRRLRDNKPVISGGSQGHAWLAAFLLIPALSLFYTQDFGLTLRAVADLSVFIILYYLIINILQEKAHLKVLISFIIGIAVALSLYGIYQYFFEFRQISKMVDNYIAQGAQDTRWDLVKGALNQKRISSVFGLHNMFASFLGMIIPVSVAYAWFEKEKRAKVGIILATLAMSFAMLLTFSIGSWLSLFLILCIEIILLWRIKRSLRLPFLLSGLVFLIIVVSIIVGIKRFSPATVSSFQSRWMYLVSSFKIIKDYFFTGAGWGAFEKIYLNYMLPGKVNPVLDNATKFAHNLYIQVFAEIGIFGLIVFCLFLFKLLKNNLRAIKVNDDRFTQYLGVGVFSGILFFLAHNIIDIGFYFFQVALFWWVLLAMFAALRANAPENKPFYLSPAVWRVFSVLIFAFLILNSFAEWHFYKGCLFEKERLYDKSIDEFTKASKLNPLQPRFAEKKGDAYLDITISSKGKSNMLNLARLQYLGAMRLSKHNPQLYYKLGLISQIKGDLPDAIANYKNAIFYFPAAELYKKALRQLEPAH